MLDSSPSSASGWGGHDVRFVSFVSLRVAGHDVRFVSFVVGHPKESRGPSVAESASEHESDSVAFTTHVRLASLRGWPGTMSDSSPSWSATRRKVVRLRLDSVDRDEAPSWSFSEASQNDSEGASVAFVALTAENWCASDHDLPSCAATMTCFICLHVREREER